MLNKNRDISVMEKFRELYHIVIEHDYFEGESCDVFSCNLTRQSEVLAKRRGFFFRQVAANEWGIFYQNKLVEDDVVTLSLFVNDSQFPLYTAWDDFKPTLAFELELHSATTQIDADKSFVQSQNRRTIGMGLCTMSLHLDKTICDAAESGNPISVKISFHARSLKWTYVFIPRRDLDFSINKLSLDDSTGNMLFSEFTDYSDYASGASCTSSQTEIPMRHRYGCKLRLVAHDVDERKIVLLSSVPPPEPGRFMDAPSGTIKQICYY